MSGRRGPESGPPFETGRATERAAGQGPRWEVFKQDAPDRPYQAVGSVHAADAEHALLMARSVFARRPRASGLWVVPANAVERVTEEALARDAGLPATGEAGEARAYEVFRKAGHRRGMTFVDHVARIVAEGPREAIEAARRDDDGEGIVWWACPAEAVSASPESEADAWFGPAEDKTYKHQGAYATVTPRTDASRGGEGGR